MTKLTTQNLIYDIINVWNEQHPTELMYEDNMTDDSICVYRDDSIELNFEPVDNGLTLTFFNLDTNTVQGQFEFTYDETTDMTEWVDGKIDFLERKLILPGV